MGLGIDDLHDDPSPTVIWAWSDGCLHDEPPLPCAFVAVRDAGRQLSSPWYEPVEAPCCGAVLDVRDARDGQRRIFVCDREVGHPADNALRADDRHRAVTDRIGGCCVTWQAPTP